MPELRHLRYFVAVAEELNFSRAAKRLRMAQPPLSVAIRQLEAELGTQLFKRTSREVTLTEAGQALLDGARRTLAEADRAVSDARRAGSGQTGSLRIGFSWSERFETLPALGQAFRARRPDVELLTEEMWNARMIPALRSGAIDVALSLCPERSDGIVYTPVRSEPAVAILSKTNRLADEREIALTDLADESFVLFPRELAPRLHDRMIDFCRQAGFEPTLRSESFHSGWELQLLGGLPVVALAPSSVARGLPKDLVAVPLEPAPHLETQALSRADDLSPVLAVFLDVVAALDGRSVLRAT